MATCERVTDIDKVDNQLLETASKTNEPANVTYSYELLQNTATFLLERISIRPKIGIICGSGLGGYWNDGSLADNIKDKQCFPYETIPNFPVGTSQGHYGQLVFGHIAGIPVVCMQGRFQYYEGYNLWKCCMPVRVMKLIGVTHLIVSNAAGGLDPSYTVGDIMIVKDHINMMGFAGNSPLLGPNDDRFGPRFPPMNKAYCTQIREIAKQVAAENSIKNLVHEGVYTCLGGPNFETVAELRMLRKAGVDAVGLSTVHEVITARHCGMTVFAFSLITNKCITDYVTDKETIDIEIIDVGKMRQELLSKFISDVIFRLSKLTLES